MHCYAELNDFLYLKSYMTYLTAHLINGSEMYFKRCTTLAAFNNLNSCFTFCIAVSSQSSGRDRKKLLTLHDFILFHHLHHWMWFSSGPSPTPARVHTNAVITFPCITSNLTSTLDMENVSVALTALWRRTRKCTRACYTCTHMHHVLVWWLWGRLIRDIWCILYSDVCSCVHKRWFLRGSFVKEGRTLVLLLGSGRHVPSEFLTSELTNNCLSNNCSAQHRTHCRDYTCHLQQHQPERSGRNGYGGGRTRCCVAENGWTSCCTLTVFNLCKIWVNCGKKRRDTTTFPRSESHGGWINQLEARRN